MRLTGSKNKSNNGADISYLLNIFYLWNANFSLTDFL